MINFCHLNNFKAQQSNSYNKENFVQEFVQNSIAGMEGKLLKIFCKLVFVLRENGFK